MGDTFVLREEAPEPAKKLEADLCWFDDTPLSTQRKYLLKQTTNTVFRRAIGSIREVLDVHTLSQATDRKELTMNDIGRVALTLQKPLVCDVYDSHQGTGAFRVDRRSDASYGCGWDDPGVFRLKRVGGLLAAQRRRFYEQVDANG